MKATSAAEGRECGSGGIALAGTPMEEERGLVAARASEARSKNENENENEESRWNHFFFPSRSRSRRASASPFARALSLSAQALHPLAPIPRFAPLAPLRWQRPRLR